MHKNNMTMLSLIYRHVGQRKWTKNQLSYCTTNNHLVCNLDYRCFTPESRIFDFNDNGHYYDEKKPGMARGRKILSLRLGNLRIAIIIMLPEGLH